MSDAKRSEMPRIILHRSCDRLHLEYEDGHREEFRDKERIRWLLLECNSLVSSIKKCLYFPCFYFWFQNDFLFFKYHPTYNPPKLTLFKRMQQTNF